MRRSESTDFVAPGSQQRFQQGDTGALAICARDGDDRTTELEDTKPGSDGTDALQPQINSARMQTLLPNQPLIKPSKSHLFFHTPVSPMPWSLAPWTGSL